MKVLVLGATGRTGSAVVEQALAAGHQVTVLVRNADGYQGPAPVAVRQGDATDGEAVAAALAGQDAVIDTIGGKTPYKATVTLEVDVARALVAAMQREGVRRVLVTSSLGVGDSTANATPFLRVLTKTFLRGSTKDKAAMERVLEASGLDWTITRPAVLTDDRATGDLRVYDSTTGEKVHKTARVDLAAWLVTHLDDTSWVQRTVTLANS
jgi:putative NADH-flavin reductase